MLGWDASTANTVKQLDALYDSEMHAIAVG
jgi:hypothetical protein